MLGRRRPSFRWACVVLGGLSMMLGVAGFTTSSDELGRLGEPARLPERTNAVAPLHEALGRAGSRDEVLTVVLDPGHDEKPNLATEPIGPRSTHRKIKDGGGTRGAVTGTPEAVVNLDIALRLRRHLERAGLRVVMTRTVTRGRSMGNVARARIANRSNAALFLRIHADGSTNPARRGTHTLYPALRPGWTADIYRPSRRAARIIQQALARKLGSVNLGLTERSDITGFNWANVPAVLVEVGFLTNPKEDRLLNSRRYRRRAATGLCRGVLQFLRLSDQRPAARC